MKKLIIIILLIYSISVVRVGAQVDPHFSQYYAYPLFINPALVGNIEENFRVTAIRRNQYISGNDPYISSGITVELNSGKHFGYGLSIINQTASNSAYHNLNANLNLSYKAFLDETHILAAGFQVGIVNRYINPSRFTFSNQYNPLIGFDPSMVSGESFNNNKSLAFDVSAGLIYLDASPNTLLNPFIGVSIYHINKPITNFLVPSSREYLPQRYVINGGARINVSDRIDFTPHFILMQQGDAKETAVGILTTVKVVPSTNILIGSTYRFNDAIIPTIGLEYNSLNIGFSYDVSNSAYKASSNYQGGYEISISIGHRKNKTLSKNICPRF